MAVTSHLGRPHHKNHQEIQNKRPLQTQLSPSILKDTRTHTRNSGMSRSRGTTTCSHICSKSVIDQVKTMTARTRSSIRKNNATHKHNDFNNWVPSVQSWQTYHRIELRQFHLVTGSRGNCTTIHIFANFETTLQDQP